MNDNFDKNTWATPQYLFDWLNSIYLFDIDLCASGENTKCAAWFDERDNSLIKQWYDHGSRGFCNPPYSNIKPWIEKAMEEADKGFITVMLIPTPNGESHYHEIFVRAKSITFITGRIAFYNPYLKKEVSGNSRGSCVVEFSGKYNDFPIQINYVMRDALKVNYYE